jgi:hypothetical protein
MFDSNRERISGAVKNSLHTGADLRAALTGSAPPDDAFVESIAEAMAMVTLDSHLGADRTLILPGRIGPATRESA